jgi:hypothetical protein
VLNHAARAIEIEDIEARAALAYRRSADAAAAPMAGLQPAPVAAVRFEVRVAHVSLDHVLCLRKKVGRLSAFTGEIKVAFTPL